MIRFLLFVFSFSWILNIKAQNNPLNTKDSAMLVYHGIAPHINDLIHTKLEVRFDYSKSYLYGKAWITLKPHFYATDSLYLDAKGMDINKVALANGTVLTTLKYTYSGLGLFIKLDKKYTANDKYIVYIDYTSKPNELKVKG